METRNNMKKLKNRLIASKCILEVEIYRQVRLAAIKHDTTVRNFIKLAVLEKLEKEK